MTDLAPDEIAGLTPDNASKILEERGFGSTTLHPLLEALALDPVVMPSAEKLHRLGTFERRNAKRGRIRIIVLARCD